MANTLFILNDPPYGTERSYNGLRVAGLLSKVEGERVRVFLIGEGAACAHGHQKIPGGQYSIEVMLKAMRGIADAEFVDGTKRSSMGVLTAWTREADKVLVF